MSQTMEVMRSEIKFAPFNPKIHTPEEIDEMVNNFHRVGFMGGIVYNVITGNLLDGHKRLMSLDYINGYNGKPSTDYIVKVECVKLDMETEKEQNLFFTFSTTPPDTDLMRQLIPDVDTVNAGLDEDDLRRYGIEPEADYSSFIEQSTSDEVIQPEATEESEGADECEVTEGEPKSKQYEALNKASEDDNNYLMLVFASKEGRDDFLNAYNLSEHTTAISGEALSELIRLKK